MEIRVNCRGAESDWVVIKAKNLPEDGYDVVYLLKTEYAARHVWMEVASAYFERGKWASGIFVLTEATSDAVDTMLRRAPPHSRAQCTRLDLLAALSGAYIMLADTQSADGAEREQTLERARGVFTSARRRDFDLPSIWVAEGWEELQDRSSPALKEWLESPRGKMVVMASLGLASMQLNRLSHLERSNGLHAKSSGRLSIGSVDSEKSDSTSDSLLDEPVALAKRSTVNNAVDKADLMDAVQFASPIDIRATNNPAVFPVDAVHLNEAIGACNSIEVSDASDCIDAIDAEDPVELLLQALRARCCPAGVWTGLAHALFRENRLDLARSVAERAVLATRDAGPAERREALYVLARVEMSDKKRLDTALIAAVLREAYVECGGTQDARLLTLLAEFNIKRNSPDLAEQFACEAVARSHDTPSASIGAMYAGVRCDTYVQALFQHGRALHRLHRSEEAMNAFEKIKAIADSKKGRHMKINFGVYLRLGMLKLATGKKEDEKIAEECLEKVVDNNDHRVFVAFRALGCLLGRREVMKARHGNLPDGESHSRAIALLETGLTKKKGERDIPAQLVYAALHEEMSPDIALRTYEKVVSQSKRMGLEVDVAVRVNMALLLARMNRAQEAQEIFDVHVDDKLLDPARPSINYNRGRIAEMLENDEMAVTFYKTLTKEDPPFWEAQIRLALIAKARNRTEEAEELFKTAMKNPHTRSVAAAYLSKLYSGQKKFKEAQDILEENRHDCEFMALSFAQFMQIRPVDANGERIRQRRVRDVRRVAASGVGRPAGNATGVRAAWISAARKAGRTLKENTALQGVRGAFIVLLLATASVFMYHFLQRRGIVFSFSSVGR